MDTDDLFNDEDLDAAIARPGGAKAAAAGPPAAAKQQPAELLQSMDGLSARERNQAKRRAKALARAEGGGGGGRGECQAQGACVCVRTHVPGAHTQCTLSCVLECGA